MYKENENGYVVIRHDYLSSPAREVSFQTTLPLNNSHRNINTIIN